MSAAAPAQPDYFATGWTGGRSPWVIALVVTMATFMEVLDTSIANVSLAHIAGSLSVSQDESTWVLTSYLVANAIVLPISGWIASKVGRKRFYMTCVLLFTIASFLCGMAPTLGTLIFCRVLQGIGGGGLAPSEQSILADTFPPEKRGMAFALYGMAVIAAPAIGPTLGGFITEHYTWRWVFFINIPVGALSLFLTSRVVSDPPHLKQARATAGNIDFVGLALIAIGLGTLEVVLDKGQEDDWFHSSFIIGFSLVAVVCLVAFVIWEWHQEKPIVEVRLFKLRSFAAANLMMLTLGMMLYAPTVLLPAFLQSLMGYSAERAGWAVSPGGLTVVCLMPLVGTLVSRIDPRRMIGFGFCFCTFALFYMTSHIYQGIDFGTAVKLRMLQSAGLAFLFVPINTIVYVGIPSDKTNSVSGIVNLSRNMGGDIGIALLTTLLARRAQFHQTMLASHTNLYSEPFVARMNGIARALEHSGSAPVEAGKKAMAAMYGLLLQQSATLAYIDVLKVFGVITALMIPVVFLTRRPPPGAAAPGGH